ncbi:hypothetical protein AACH06_15055 [Ideonella sp. DXS29W]|uniref:Autotransporter outer membrane beta-barrel domain-containing protein n=1 Tax=Ideonella lacteola TaxID=2984193 RepID=A0ABU9BSP3_9BURK
MAEGLVWGGEASIATDFIERGMSPWPTDAVAQGLLTVSDNTAWAATLALTAPEDHARDYLVVARGAAYGHVGDNWQWQAHAGVYVYPGGGPAYRAFDRAEAGLSAGYRDVATLTLSALRMTGKPADDHLYPAAELSLRWPLSDHWTLAAGVGRSEVLRWPGVWYTYGDVGVEWQAGPWRAALRQVGASDAARPYMAGGNDPRTTVSLGWQF